MKKIKFIANATDKITNEKYKVGDIKEFKNERADEILKARRKNGKAFAELVEEIEEVETAVKKEDKENTSKKVKKK